MSRKKQRKLIIGILAASLVFIVAAIAVLAASLVRNQRLKSEEAAKKAASSTASTEASIGDPVSAPASEAQESAPAASESTAAEPTAAASTAENVNTGASKIVCIDPGHETEQITDLEPNGPGSDTMKAGVTSGTQGVDTGRPEYEVVLEVGLQLRDLLQARGYTVVMTRETNDVKITNVQRAQIATEANADIFIRLHCNGVDNQEVNGVLCYGPTDANPYLSEEVIKGSQRLCQLLRDYQAKSTGQKVMDNLFEDNMTGINWTTMPVAIVEMGFMTNVVEDWYLCSEEGQAAIAYGLANGVDAYFAGEGQ